LSELIISVSGLRGIVGRTLTPEVAVRYVNAFCQVLPDGPVVVGRDGRPSGEMLRRAVEAALQAAGRDVVDASILPTPTMGVLVRNVGAAGGVQITASHNPPPYNGLKLFSAEGRVFPDNLGRRVLEHYHEKTPRWVEHEHLGTARACDDPLTPHLEAVLATVDRQRIRSRAFRVLLDSNHGAGGTLGRRLLERLGCQVTILGEEPHGRFAHPPEPIAQNLHEVCEAVRRAQVDIGFCQDPDADRLAVIDEQGRYLGEEYTLALCVEHVLRRRKGPVVTNCSTSRMTEDLARKYGVVFHRSKVGEAHVVDAMLQHQAVFGGEGNGGPIDPRVGLVRDSFVGMALILDAVAQRELPVSRLAADLPRYAIHKTKVALAPQRVAEALDSLERRFAEAKADRLDGLRLDWPDKWLLVRPSNTEPIVRIVAEAGQLDEAETLCRRAAETLQAIAEGR